MTGRGRISTFVLDGELDVVLGPKRQHWRLPAGHGLVTAPRTPFRYSAAPDTRLLAIELGDVFDAPPSISIVSATRLPSRLAQRMARVEYTPSETALRGVLDEVRALTTEHQGLEAAHNTARLLNVKHVLDRGFRGSFRFEAVAARYGLQASYLSREFKRLTGTSPQQYVQLLRLEHFLVIFLKSDRPLAQIAEESGFSDYPTFCRAARRRFGVAPRRLRIDQSNPSPGRPAA